MTGNIWIFKTYVQNFGCPEKNVGEAKLQNLMHNIAY